MSNIFSFGEGDSNIGGRKKAWKAEGGTRYRASFCWFDVVNGKFDLAPGKAPKFAGAQTLYIPGVGHVQSKGPEYVKLAGEAPKTRILTFLVLWPTNKQGVLDKNRITTDFEVKPWVFSADKYNQLKAINSEFPLAQHDVTIDCSDAQYQKMTFAPCKESLLATLQEKGASEVISSIVAAVQDLASNPADFIGREMTIQQIREKLAGGTGAGISTSAGDKSVATTDIDSVVDDLLG